MTLRPYPPASEGAHQRSHERPPSRPKASRWPRTILLVEDEPFVREATRSILESLGFEVLSAEDASAALKLYETSMQPIDLVMTDMILPGCTGQQLSEDLLQRSPSLKVLLTSGYSSAEYAASAPQPRAHFLAKPYSRRGLIAKIEEIFTLPLQVLPLHRAAGKVS
jgi:two-component system cell cycle sensor histidine kinase/response regulator CckA